MATVAASAAASNVLFTKNLRQDWCRSRVAFNGSVPDTYSSIGYAVPGGTIPTVFSPVGTLHGIPDHQQVPQCGLGWRLAERGVSGHYEVCPDICGSLLRRHLPHGLVPAAGSATALSDPCAPKPANRIVIFKEISGQLAPPHPARVKLGCRLAHPAQPSPPMGQWGEGG